MSLRSKVIRLAHANPELRKDLLPLLKHGISFDPDPQDEKIVAIARKSLESAVRPLKGRVLEIQQGRSGPFANPTVMGDEWWGEMEFPGKARGGSWARISISKGVDSPRSKPGMYHIDSRIGLEDARGNRGNVPVQGAPDGWFKPNQMKQAIAQTVSAIQGMIRDWQAS